MEGDSRLSREKEERSRDHRSSKSSSSSRAERTSNLERDGRDRERDYRRDDRKPRDDDDRRTRDRRDDRRDRDRRDRDGDRYSRNRDRAMGDWMDERKKREGKTDKEREEKEAAEAQRKKEEEEERAYLATVEAELGDIGSDFEDFDEDAVARKKADERKARLAAIRAKHGEPEKPQIEEPVAIPPQPIDVESDHEEESSVHPPIQPQDESIFSALIDRTSAQLSAADMFSDEAIIADNTTNIAEADISNDHAQPHLQDNWDDSEGYYKANIGEIMNGRYKVMAVVGAGVFSTVLRVKDLSQTGEVFRAIKVLRANDTMHRSGLKESAIIKTLSQGDQDIKRFCIRCYGHFESRGHLCLVYELMSMSLREVLKKFSHNRGLNIKAIRIFTAQLLGGLKHLKSHRIIHADIKPDNILINENRNMVKLADFGSASTIDENEITPYLVARFYRSPEIILGLPYDYRLDLWSVACTVFELATGSMLFKGRDNNQMIALMIEVKGRFPAKMLKKGHFKSQHFDEELRFKKSETDPATQNERIRIITPQVAPTRPLESMLVSSAPSKQEVRDYQHLADLLDKMTMIDPQKRITIDDALDHVFLAPLRKKKAPTLMTPTAFRRK